jgi:GR25 family glycosyltransferase involved in LPS biosynthesis
MRRKDKVLVFYGIIVLAVIIAIYMYYRKNYSEGFEGEIKLESPSLPEYIISDISVINLDKSNDRRVKMRKQTSKIKNIPVLRWNAVNGKEISEDKINNICNESCKGWTGEKRNRGQVGCYLSHKTLLNYLKTLNVNPNAGHIIFEDDIVIDDDFLTKWKKIIPHVPSNWGIIYFDLQKNGEIKMNNVKNGIGDAVSGWGTHAYMVKHSRIPEILSKVNVMYAPIDNMLQDNFKNFNAYILEENIVKITGEDGSDIG